MHYRKGYPVKARTPPRPVQYELLGPLMINSGSVDLWLGSLILLQNSTSKHSGWVPPSTEFRADPYVLWI